MNAPVSVTLLGATGSVGRSAVQVIQDANANCANRFTVEAVTAGSDVEALARTAIETGARFAAIADERLYGALRERLFGTGILVAAGSSALVEAADRPADRVLAAIVGSAGLKPTLAAVRRGAIIALANKEALVCAGSLMRSQAWRFGARLLPVDSEHSAIFQAMTHPHAVEKLFLTASGGPFRQATEAAMRQATPAQACKHPVWSMGAKISVDSATMMNKGLELIEASYLFDVDESRIDILVHPQSVVHSMVSFVDGSVLAQLGTPDMKAPIAYALAWPDRLATRVERLDLTTLSALSFEAPDPAKFPALRLARTALQAENGAPTVLNAANECAVAAFLAERIGFLDIARCVEEALEAHDAGRLTGADSWARGAGSTAAQASLEEIVGLDKATRQWTDARLRAMALA